MDPQDVLNLIGTLLAGSGHPAITAVTVSGRAVVAKGHGGAAAFVAVAHIAPTGVRLPERPSWPCQGGPQIVAEDLYQAPAGDGPVGMKPSYLTGLLRYLLDVGKPAEIVAVESFEDVGISCPGWPPRGLRMTLSGDWTVHA